MLNSVSLRHFKCFEVLDLPLAPLTLLSGANATGKSSVLQSLLLLHQTIQLNEASSDLLLNGYATQIGTVGDVIDQISGRRSMSIGLRNGDFECTWTMDATDRRMTTFPVQQITWRMSPSWIQEKQTVTPDTALRKLLPIRVDDLPASSMMESVLQLSYISADRSGPREAYPVSPDNIYPTVGVRGEYTPWYLYAHDQSEIVSGLKHPREVSSFLRKQVDAWMHHFFPGSSILVEQITSTNLVKLLIRTSEKTDFLRPQNVGYGLTHVLPIVVACLGAAKGRIIVVENPETHLHPAAQSAMGEFLSKAAASGLQVLIETHSDHVLNGIRKAIKSREVDSESVLIHFFADREGASQVTSPQIDDNGNIDHWPENFFDQYDRDLSDLIDWI